MLCSWIVQSQKCYSGLEKTEIAKRLNELIYSKKNNSNLNKQIFELQSVIVSKNVSITTFKQKVLELEGVLDNKDGKLSVLSTKYKNQKEQTKIAKRKKLPAFIKGVGVGGVIVFVIIKIIL